MYNAPMFESMLKMNIAGYSVPFFFWNIFLAIIPFLLAKKFIELTGNKKWKSHRWQNKLGLLALFFVWFFFFPNAPYLFSDIRHLVDYCQDPGYLNTCPQRAYLVPLFFTYAIIGIPTFYYGLEKMREGIEKNFNKKISHWMVKIMIPITGLGLILGLMGRFNSWQIISHPWIILKTAGEYLIQPIMLANIGSYTLMMYIIYYFIKAIHKK